MTVKSGIVALTENKQKNTYINKIDLHKHLIIGYF